MSATGTETKSVRSNFIRRILTPPALRGSKSTLSGDQDSPTTSRVRAMEHALPPMWVKESQMGKVYAALAVSVDGYISGRDPRDADGGVGQGLGDAPMLFDWYFDGAVPSKV